MDSGIHRWVYRVVVTDLETGEVIVDQSFYWRPGFDPEAVAKKYAKQMEEMWPEYHVFISKE